MKTLVVLAQRQLRLPLASRRAGGAHSRGSRIARNTCYHPQNPFWAMHLPPHPAGITAPGCRRASEEFDSQRRQQDAASANIASPLASSSPTRGGTGSLTCIPGAVGRQQQPQQQGHPRSHAGPIPGPGSIPLFEPENRRSGAARVGGPGVGVVFAHLRSLLTALVKLATLLTKIGSGLGGGPGFLKPAPFSPSYEAGSCEDMGRFPQRLFLAHAQAWNFLWCFSLLHDQKSLISPATRFPPLQGASQPELWCPFLLLFPPLRG